VNVAQATRRVTACAVAFATGTMLCSGAAQGDGPTRYVPAIPGLPTDPAVIARILALDPDALTERDVRETLVHAPAPRIIALHGSLPIVTMEPFARFMIAMGYPDERIRNANDGSYSHGSFGSGARLAGMLAWYYEHEGMMPMLIGHSQGGMLVVRTLHELAGGFASSVAVWDPVADAPLPRSTIVDPRDGRTRPVVGLVVPYAAALATGFLPRLLLLQWDMLPRLRAIPDSVEEFAGYTLEWDPVAGELPGGAPYAATGSANVRNITLPSDYHHVTLPQAEALAGNPVTRAWIEAYLPDSATPGPSLDGAADTTNLLHAADIWRSVKQHWCLEAQRLIRATAIP
jgi:hypothetical protein